MTTKATELKMAAEGRGCLGASKDDEPVFVLCGRDPFAPQAVDAWCDSIEKTGNMSDARRAKVKEAREMAATMRKWRQVNPASASPVHEQTVARPSAVVMSQQTRAALDASDSK